MSMKLTIGVARKLGQPRYGSLGASCGVELELELDGSALRGDPAEFHRRVRLAYDACARAVDEELRRLQAGPDGPGGCGDRYDGGPSPPRQPATAAQVRALGRLAARRGLDLDALAAERFGVDGPEELSVAEASRLIDELKRDPAGAAV